MKNTYGDLLKPYKIGNMTLKNRVCMAPMDYMYFDGDEDQSTFNYRWQRVFEARAKGGCGLLFTCAVQAEREIMPYPRALKFPGIDSDERVKEFSAVADYAHFHGAKMGCELTMGSGRYADIIDPKRPPIAPSDCQTQYNPEVRARAMTQEEIDHMIRTYAEAAGRLKASGFDCLLIMGGGGYLINQFLSPAWNQRTDKYGGSVEKRATFLIETIQAVKKVVGDDYPIICSLNMDDLLPEGVSDSRGVVIEEIIETAQILERMDLVDGFHLRIGNYYNQENIIPSAYWDNSAYRKNFAKFKAAVTKPVIFENRLTDPEEMQAMIENNETDMVSLGRNWIADPDWANKALKGENIRPCLRCNMCLHTLWLGKCSACAVNPVHGFEFEGPIVPAPKKKHVVVIGAGPAGVTAALTAEERGHKVTLIEKEAVVGGKLPLVAKPDYKNHYEKYIKYLQRAIDESGVELICNMEAKPDQIKAMNPDVVIIATGADPIVPPVKGIEKAVLADDVLKKNVTVGKDVAIIGGGLVGCETAYWLAKQGHQAHIIEMREDILLDASYTTIEAQRAKLAIPEIDKYVKTRVTEVADGKVICLTEDSKTVEVSADSVILAAGYKGNQSLYNDLWLEIDEVYQVGDNAKTGKIFAANHQAYQVAKYI